MASSCSNSASAWAVRFLLYQAWSSSWRVTLTAGRGGWALRGSGEGTAEERKESARILECDLLPQAQDLLRALHRYRHSQDEAPAIQTHHLIRAYVLGIRTLIYVCLQSPKQNDSAKYAISLSLQYLVGLAKLTG